MRVTRVRLLEEDPDLAVGIDPAQAQRAEQALVVPAVHVEPGPFAAADVSTLEEARGEVFALLLLDGTVAVDLHVASRRCTQLLGAGDVLPVDSSTLPVPVHLVTHVDQRARFALLDDRFLGATQRWPTLAKRLMRRMTYLQQEASLRQAIAQLPQVENRLLGAFWCLADRWGSVGTEGVTVDLAITHDALGSYVGARRPTVSLGLKALADAGLLTRPERDRWLLSFGSLEALETGRPVAPVAPRVRVPAGRTVTARDRARLRERLRAVRETNERGRARSEAAIAASRLTRASVDRRRGASGGPPADAE